MNVLGQSLVFNDVLRGEAPNITYEINNTNYQNGYYLVDDIYLRWTTFMKSIPHPRSQKQKLFAAYQRVKEKMSIGVLVSSKPGGLLVGVRRACLMRRC